MVYRRAETVRRQVGIRVPYRGKRENILVRIGWKKDTIVITIKAFLLSLGGILVFIALLSPQKLKEEKKIEVQGSDIYILMDISKSMLAEDTYPNRLEISKRELKEILNNLKGDRIGIIPFSDSAYVQMPLTDDYFMAINYINNSKNNGKEYLILFCCFCTF